MRYSEHPRGEGTVSEPLRRFRPPSLKQLIPHRKPIRNVNKEHQESLTGLDRLALFITERVGTMGFFLTIFAWTVCWCGYNILATEVPSLRWKPFDPFPSFVAYLLMSNVIQILLMPLIMVGQNLQGRHSELRAENDFEVNVKAEKEVEIILRHLEFQNAVLITMLEKLGVNREEAIASLTAHGLEPYAVVDTAESDNRPNTAGAAPSAGDASR
jgi:uncharacterized membrane protein